MSSTLTLFAGTATPELASRIADDLGVQLGRATVQVFPDGELQIELQQTVRGHDVFLINSTSPPAERHALELVLLADACDRAGAALVTAVVPYFGYARQDRRTGRQPLGGRVLGEVLCSGAIRRVITVDLHAPAIEGSIPVPVEHLTAVPLLTEAIRPLVGDRAIVVAPDLGGAKLAGRYARLLGLPLAIIHKSRISGREVSVSAVVGDVKGRLPIIVDDMLSTGETIRAAVAALLDAGARSDMVVAVSHSLFVGGAEESLRPLPIRRFVTTDSVTPNVSHLPIDVRGLGALLAETIRSLHG